MEPVVFPTTFKFVLLASVVGLLLFITGLSVRKEFFEWGEGEFVQIDDAKMIESSLLEKVGLLHQLAVFPTIMVHWRRYFLSALLGGLISLGLLSLNNQPGFLPQLLIIIFPTFLVMYLLNQHMAWHGPSRIHFGYANRLKTFIERDLLSPHHVPV